MKKTLLTLALVAATAAAFAQGKVQVNNDGASAITLGDSAHVRAADQGVAGLAVATSAPLPSGVVLNVGLYAGASSSSLSLAAVSSSSPNTDSPISFNPVGGQAGGPAPGIIGIHKYQLSAFPSGTIFVQLKVWDSAFASYDLALAGGSYTGLNNVSQITLGTSLAYPSIVNGAGSTWAAAGNASPLVVGIPGSVTPEPGTMALAGLGAAAMMVFRRRNK